MRIENIVYNTQSNKNYELLDSTNIFMKYESVCE